MEQILIKLLGIQTALAQFGRTYIDINTGELGVFGARGDKSSVRRGIELINPLGTYNFQVIIDRVINGLLLLAAPVVVIMVLWGAFLLITSGGNPAKVSQGWQVILWAAVGYGVLLLASGINLVVQQLLGIY